MSNWLSKSKQSFSIANDADSLMLNNRVHCYYYGCVQLLKHIVLNNFSGMTIDKVNQECDRRVVPENKGTHQYLRLKIKDDLNNKQQRLKGVDFNTHILGLHNLRTKADYGIDDINEDEFELAQSYSNNINTTITAFYNI